MRKKIQLLLLYVFSRAQRISVARAHKSAIFIVFSYTKGLKDFIFVKCDKSDECTIPFLKID